MPFKLTKTSSDINAHVLEELEHIVDVYDFNGYVLTEQHEFLRAHMDDAFSYLLSRLKYEKWRANQAERDYTAQTGKYLDLSDDLLAALRKIDAAEDIVVDVGRKSAAIDAIMEPLFFLARVGESDDHAALAKALNTFIQEYTLDE